MSLGNKLRLCLGSLFTSVIVNNDMIDSSDAIFHRTTSETWNKHFFHIWSIMYQPKLTSNETNIL